MISNKPKCRTCGKDMIEWNLMAETHEHSECTVERISDNLSNILKKQLKNGLYR